MTNKIQATLLHPIGIQALVSETAKYLADILGLDNPPHVEAWILGAKDGQPHDRLIGPEDVGGDVLAQTTQLRVIGHALAEPMEIRVNFIEPPPRLEGGGPAAAFFATRSGARESVALAVAAAIAAARLGEGHVLDEPSILSSSLELTPEAALDAARSRVSAW
jgi:hypothetical protein